jgi:hypothetical protein
MSPKINVKDMKKNVLFAIIFMLSSYSIAVSDSSSINHFSDDEVVEETDKKKKEKSQSQNNQKNTLVYHFKLRNNPPKSVPVPYREYVRYAIEDINPFIYKVQIENEIVNFKFEMPKELETDLFKVEEVKKEENDAKEKSRRPIDALIKADNTTYKTKYDKYVNTVKKLNKLNNIFENLVIVVETERNTLTEISSQIQNLMQSYASNSSKTGAELKVEFNDHVNNAIQEVYSAFEELISKSSPSNTDEETLKKLAINLNEKVQDVDYKDISSKVIKIYDQSLSPNTFSVFSSPIYADADRIKFIVKIDPVEGLKYAQPSRKEKFDVVLDTYKRWKIDFSSGIFLTNLVSNTYTTKQDKLPDSAEMGQRIVREDEGKWKIGLGVMMHGYYKAWPGIGLGGNLGIITNTNSLVQYLVGGSLILGNSQRIILNGGIALGYVNRLSSGLDENEFVQSASSISTKTVFKSGGYFGISYNLTRSTQKQ